MHMPMPKPSKRRVALAVLALVVAGAVAAPAQAAKVVHVRGGPSFKPNAFFGQNNRFDPGHRYVTPGGWVRWEDHDRTIEPHTIMVVTHEELPKTVAQILACPVCDRWRQHLEDPNDPNSPVTKLKVNVGKSGFQVSGDSLYLRNGARIAARINAPIGKEIRYICAFHPWMQGMLMVTRSGMAPMSGGHH
jgi:plastocyanin